MIDQVSAELQILVRQLHRLDGLSLRVSVTVTLSCSTMEIDIRSACRACLSTGKESFYSFTSYPEVRQLFVECTSIQVD